VQSTTQKGWILLELSLLAPLIGMTGSSQEFGNVYPAYSGW
jgi:hypothetical protein